MSYLFFLSYAREDNKAGANGNARLVERFFIDLRNVVRAKTGLPENRIGFFDAEDIELGAEWSSELVDALQTSKVFISVFSPTYFTKTFCGREWTVFYRRQWNYASTLAGGAEEPRLMIPILWEKEVYVGRAMPAQLKAYQYSHGSFGENYPKFGLRQILSDENLYRAYYADFVDKFSDKLIEAAEQHPAVPPLSGGKPLEEVEPIFPETAPATAQPQPQRETAANPRYVKFVFVVGGQAELQAAKIRHRLEYYGDSGREWKPYLPDVADEIDVLVNGILSPGRFSPDGVIPLGESLLQQIREARSNNQIVVLVVDTWTLRIQSYSQWMREFDEASFLNCIVVIPWNNDDETSANQELLDKVILDTFANRDPNNSPNFLCNIGSVGELQSRLAEKLRETKEEIIRRAAIRREISSGSWLTKPGISAAGKE